MLTLGPDDLDLRVARDAALAVRRVFAEDHARVDVRLCAARFGAEIREAELGASRGGLQGMLVPLPEDRFRIAIDPTPKGGWDAGGDADIDPAMRNHRVRFRVAHELGHILFYRRSRGARPSRAFVAGTAEEEAFCDEFARHLLVPYREGRVRAEGVVEAHQAYDVSLEVAARTAASPDLTASVALWRWDRPLPGRRAALHVQWATGPKVCAEADVVECRTDPADLMPRFAAARRRIGDRFSAVVLRERRQALAVLT